MNLVLVRIWEKKINDCKRTKEVAIGKVAVHLCLTLIIKELKINVEQDRVVTTLNIIFNVPYQHMQLLLLSCYFL